MLKWFLQFLSHWCWFKSLNKLFDAIKMDFHAMIDSWVLLMIELAGCMSRGLNTGTLAHHHGRRCVLWPFLFSDLSCDKWEIRLYFLDFVHSLFISYLVWHTSPSLDSNRSSFLQMAWMSPASARIWMPLGASISRERVGDSSLEQSQNRTVSDQCFDFIFAWEGTQTQRKRYGTWFKK